MSEEAKASYRIDYEKAANVKEAWKRPSHPTVSVYVVAAKNTDIKVNTGKVTEKDEERAATGESRTLCLALSGCTTSRDDEDKSKIKIV